MQFYKLILTILTIAIGFISIVVLIWKQKASTSRIFQYLAAVILLFNLWLIISLVYQSIMLHFRPYFLLNSVTLISYTYYFVSRFLQLIMVYNVVLLVWEILQKETHVLRKKRLRWVVFFFGVSLLFGFILFLATGHERFFLYSKEATATIVQWGSLIYIIILVKYAMGITDREKRISLIFVGISWILFLIAIIFLTISGYLRINPWLFNLPIEITLDFIITCAILIWTWKFSYCLTDNRIAPLVASNNTIEALASKYEFTKREQEIIELICQGKSNQEIADQLFVSLRTIKAHVYNVFKKTEVSNRLQLANLFTK